MNPFCVPFATTNMGSAMLAMDLVCLKDLWAHCLDSFCHRLALFYMHIIRSFQGMTSFMDCRDGWALIILFLLLVLQVTFVY